MIRPLLLLFMLMLGLAQPMMAQLDSIHWMPPLHARSDGGPQFIYLTTPEVQPFPVSIKNGSGALLINATISNSQPFRLDIGSSNNSATSVIEADLHKALTGKGLIFEGKKKFFATYRVHASSENHAGDLTCKGQAALGTTFRIGHIEQAPFGQNRRCNFIGVLATEDSTVVALSQYNPGVRFRVNGADMLIPANLSVTLQKGESVVFSNYIDDDPALQPPNGLLGALLEATKPVAVNCGSWLGAPAVFQGHDIGIDQIVPVELTGKEFILCKGNGSDILEHPIIVAHYPNTQVKINGGTSPTIVLGEGEYYVVSTNLYNNAGNMYIQTSQPVYMYQMIGGTAVSQDQYRTAGLMFVPPLSCGIPNAVDNIYQPNTIGTMRFDGGLMLVAMRDSAVVVRVNGNPINMGPASAVQGNPDFVTYRKLDLFSVNTVVNTVSVKAEGAVQVAMYGRNEAASFAAFFSGFTKTDKANLNLTKIGDGVCPDTLIASGRFDGVQWSLGDSVLQYGADTFFVAYTPGRYVATGYLGVCRRTDFSADSIDAVFMSPEFPYAFTTPSCFDYTDGGIDFGTPTGGIAPYQFSIDHGISYQQNNHFDGIKAGVYELVAKDSTGCYNKPLTIAIGEPDSFKVEIDITYLPEPLPPGGEVRLKGVPERPITIAVWEPASGPECPDCLNYTFYPVETTWVTLTVYDTAGCPATDRVLIEVTPAIFAPNIITPLDNSLGNHIFNLFSKDNLPVQHIAVFDRWGELVYEKFGITTNDPTSGWDGSFKGKTVQPGVFVFYAEVELLPGRVTLVKGDIVVVQ